MIPNDLQPDASNYQFDLGRRLQSVVSVKANIPDDAFTAEILGTERLGHGAVINERGLILTIGYIVTEAESIWIQAANGQLLPGDLIGYDYESGFGLVQPLGTLNVEPFPLGDSEQIAEQSNVIVAGFGGLDQALRTTLVSKSEFVGYWEYIVDEAIFTSPPHPNWGGAALIGEDGKLYGIGSLFTQEIPGLALGTEGNMFVPINLLKEILDELQKYGQTLKPARPWLGMFAAETERELIVAGVYKGAPAYAADLRAGDVIIDIDGTQPKTLGQLFRHVWSLGPAGTAIPMTINRAGKVLSVKVESSDRRAHWKAPNIH